MKKTGFASMVLALSACLFGPGRLSVVCAQDSWAADVGTAPDAPDLTNDSSTDSVLAKSADLLHRRYRVGHSTRLLDVIGIHDERRSIKVNLWYPARRFEECENAGNSGLEGDDQACSATPSVYSSRLYGIPLLPQWHPVSWTIGSTESFENVPISEAHRSFPVIVFSHGNQNNAIDYVYTLESLASFGFIVAAPDHVNNTADDVLIDYINSMAGSTVIPCFDGLSSPCARPKVPESMVDRVKDISEVIGALPSWFGDRADMSRVGLMGHSRGTVTALAAAGGSALWGISPLISPLSNVNVKAIMGLSIGNATVTAGADIQKVKVPTLLLAGTLDVTGPPQVSASAFNAVASTEKACLLISNAKHRHFDSGLCAQTQSSGAIAAANPSAILDLKTFTTLVTFLGSGVPMDFCGLDTFTTPSNVEPLVSSTAGFDFDTTEVPTTGLTSDQVKEEATQLAVIFFGHVLERDGDDDAPFTDFLPLSVPDQDPTLQGCNLLTKVP